MGEKTVFIRTFGCQMNVYDTNRMYSILSERGYRRAPSPETADLILLNSCSVRDKAEHKAMSELGKYRLIKERRPRVVLGFGGCVAQQEGKRLLGRAPFLDFVFGTQSIHLLPEILDEAAEGKGRAARTEMSPEMVVEELYPRRFDARGTKAFVSIMRGCDNYCSYCIVPYVRGREVSRKPADVLKEVESLVADGVREVTLLGQNVNSYGKGLAGSIDFAGLLERIHRVPDLLRLRFTTSHPKDFGPRLIETMAGLGKICDHLHLPVQSGSNRILKLMRRGYSVEDYLEKLALLREKIPGIAVTSDIITGFPGESERDFEQTLALVRQACFDNIFSFRYSTRPGTRAAALEDDVPEEEKLRRLAVLQELQRGISRKIGEAEVGTDVEVLVEGVSRTDAERFTGRTPGNRIVNFTCAGARPGQLATVRIDRVLKNSLSGTMHLPSREEASCSSR